MCICVPRKGSKQQQQQYGMLEGSLNKHQQQQRTASRTTPAAAVGVKEASIRSS
jgi:hypothetical protein